jgi:hypothetical protein
VMFFEGLEMEGGGPQVAARWGADEAQQPELTVDFLEENLSGPCLCRPATSFTQLRTGSHWVVVVATRCRGTSTSRC